MPWIFNYAELGPQLIVEVLGRAPLCTLPASLAGYKIVFKGRSRKWGGALASLEKGRKSFVYGTALFCTPDDIKLFDRHYRSHEKVTISIFIDATQDKVKAQTYLVPAKTYGTPGTDYSKEMLKHLKCFWGQGQKNLSLGHFGISTEADTAKEPAKAEPQKRTRRRSKQS